MSCKVGNQTNSQDPQAVNSRVFVGNLNTFQCSKTDVERIFQRYGRIAGISMHKGYAFIQFTTPFDARSACLGEDGRLIWGQTLDVNMVAEPKSHQTGRKRQNIAKTGNDWDYYYDSLKVQLESLYRSYYAQVGLPGPRLVPPMKRPRIHGPATSRPAVKAPSPNKSPHPNNALSNTNNVNANSASLTDLKTYSTPDILICGNCREHFNDVENLIEHKKTYCKLRFTCKCHLLNGKGEEPAALLCSQCKDSFSSAWDLMVHVQAAHMLNIYQLSSDPSSGGSSRDQSETREFKHMNSIMGDGIPNGLNPNGTLMGDSLMEDSHCQTDRSSTTSSSSSTSSIAGNGSSAGLISPNNHLHHHHQHHQQLLNHHHHQAQSHHLPYQQHHLHSNSNDSSTMTADVSTSTGIDNITMSSTATSTAVSTHQHIISSGAGVPVSNSNCMVVDTVMGGMGGQNSSPTTIGIATTTSGQQTSMTNSIIMTDGHNNPNNGSGGVGGGGNQSLINGNDGLMCSSSQCSTSVNHSMTNGPFGGTTPQSLSSATGGQGVVVMGQVHTNFINSNNNNNNNNSSSSSSSSSNSSYESSGASSLIITAQSQPMEASTQTQTMQVDDSLIHQNNNGPATTIAASAITNNNQMVIGNGGGSGGGLATTFDEPCSIVTKQEGGILVPFTNGQVASM